MKKLRLRQVKCFFQSLSVGGPLVILSSLQFTLKCKYQCFVCTYAGRICFALLLHVSFPALLTQEHPAWPVHGWQNFSLSLKLRLLKDQISVFSLKQLLVKAQLCGNSDFRVWRRISETFLWFGLMENTKDPWKKHFEGSLKRILSQGQGKHRSGAGGGWHIFWPVEGTAPKLYQQRTLSRQPSFNFFSTSFQNLKDLF